MWATTTAPELSHELPQQDPRPGAPEAPLPAALVTIRTRPTSGCSQSALLPATKLSAVRHSCSAARQHQTPLLHSAFVLPTLARHFSPAHHLFTLFAKHPSFGSRTFLGPSFLSRQKPSMCVTPAGNQIDTEMDEEQMRTSPLPNRALASGRGAGEPTSGRYRSPRAMHAPLLCHHLEGCAHSSRPRGRKTG